MNTYIGHCGVTTASTPVLQEAYKKAAISVANNKHTVLADIFSYEKYC